MAAHSSQKLALNAAQAHSAADRNATTSPSWNDTRRPTRPGCAPPEGWRAHRHDIAHDGQRGHPAKGASCSPTRPLMAMKTTLLVRKSPGTGQAATDSCSWCVHILSATSPRTTSTADAGQHARQRRPALPVTLTNVRTWVFAAAYRCALCDGACPCARVRTPTACKP